MQNKVNDCHSKTSSPCNHIVSIFLVLTCFSTVLAAQAEHALESQDGNAAVKFDLRDIGDLRSCPIYIVTHNNRLVITDSRLGFAIRNAVPARRSGESWFIGCMNGNDPHTLDVPLNFLDKDRRYVAHIYTDDPAVSTRTHVKISRCIVDSSSVLKAEMPPCSGQAIRIHLATAEDVKTYPRYEGR